MADGGLPRFPIDAPPQHGRLGVPTGPPAYTRPSRSRPTSTSWARLLVDLEPTSRTIHLRVCGRTALPVVAVEHGAADYGPAADARGPVLAVRAPAGARLRLAGPA